MIFGIDRGDRRDRLALIEGLDGPRWTYAELAREVELRIGTLRTSGRSLVFLFCRNNLDSVAWYLAALEAGHAVALLNDELNENLRDNLIERYRPEWIYSEGEMNGVSTGAHGSLHPDLALLLSTSGSTGSPKFVRLTRRNFEANAAAICEALGITPDDIPIAHLPIHYSYGMSVVNSHLLAGATIVLTGASLITPAFWETVRRHGVDSFSGVPYTYQMLRRLGLDKLNAPKIRIMTQAGGKLDDANISFFHQRMRERGGSFFVMYGQTEASPRITTLPSCDLPAKLGSAGRALRGGRMSIVKEDGEPAGEANTEGELVYSGPNVMMGYALNRADLALGDDLGGVLYTGDRARLDAGGYVYILGRARRDAKIFGLRINLDELEAMVKAHGPAAAISGSDRIIIFCEFGGAGEHAVIRENLCAKLKIHQSAFEFRRVERLATKATGKIDYDQLTALL